MGHDSERAALIYQHANAEADRLIADSLDARLREQRGDDEDEDGGGLVGAAR